MGDSKARKLLIFFSASSVQISQNILVCTHYNLFSLLQIGLSSANQAIYHLK